MYERAWGAGVRKASAQWAVRGAEAGPQPGWGGEAGSSESVSARRDAGTGALKLWGCGPQLPLFLCLHKAAGLQTAAASPSDAYIGRQG